MGTPPTYDNTTTTQMPPAGLRLLSIQDVCARTTLSRAAIFRKVKDRTFPQKVQISTNRVAWYEHEVEAWIRAQRFSGHAEAP